IAAVAAALFFGAAPAHGQWAAGGGSSIYYGIGMAGGYPAGTPGMGSAFGMGPAFGMSSAIGMGGYPAQPAAMPGRYANPGGYIPTGFGHGVIQGASTGGAVIQGPSGTIIAPPQSAGSIVF
ncbi:hypothetical protein H4R99_004470, partial [Coemansia sp. RSA 1722]